jgi:hypothetical protein
MNMPTRPGLNASSPCFELRFESLFRDCGYAYAFPCDARGCVDMDRLTPAARSNYLFARATVGREFLPPCVRPVQLAG